MSDSVRKIAVLAGIAVVFLLSLINFYRNVIKYEGVSLGIGASTPEPVQFQDSEGAGTSWDEVIIEKNLFSPERGVEEEQPVFEEDGVEEAPEPPPLSLKGIVMNQYGEYTALLQDGKGKTFRLRKGEEKNGFLLKEIDPVSVTLLWGDEPVELTLRRVQTIEKR
jgi:hypothetical protein